MLPPDNQNWEGKNNSLNLIQSDLKEPTVSDKTRDRAESSKLRRAQLKNSEVQMRKILPLIHKIR